MDKCNNRAIIVFARLPVEGKVKTRLAKEIGDKNSAILYQVCAEHLFKEVKKVKKYDTDLFLFYSDENETGKIKKWVGEDFYFYPQSGENLGTKMLNAFQQIFEKKYSKVIIVGTDVPDIDSTLILNAFMELDNNDFVIGPSHDGGYYLLGMKSPANHLFSNIKWGTETVLTSTLEKLNKRKIPFKLLPELIDIDIKKDIIKWHQTVSDKTKNPVKTFIEKIIKNL